MSEKVKLIIEIPKKTIAHIRSDYGHGCKGLYDEDREIIVNAIWQSKPLSEVLAEIREEIKALDEGITSYDYDDPWIYKREALEVIDKHISEEGDEE